MHDIDYREIGLRMKQARIKANYTQEQFANDLNCTPAYISNIENNRTKLNLRVLLYYSRLCSVPVEYFLDSASAKEAEARPALNETKAHTLSEPSIDQELTEILHSFSVQEKQKLIDILKIWKS